MRKLLVVLFVFLITAAFAQQNSAPNGFVLMGVVPGLVRSLSGRGADRSNGRVLGV